ncbi:MAG: guanylate kinase [Chloroflexi bacterium]|nr:guanylate kinase [Chloroflexota bacterium]
MSLKPFLEPGPLLVVLSGPSGAGKDALLTRIRQRGFPVEFITTVTTRQQRPAEQDYVDYHFTTEAAFQRMLEKSELLEWANVYGNWYGVPKGPIKQALKQGRDAIVKVDVQGAATIKKLVPEAVFIFLTPPSLEELARRIEGRRTESAPELALRSRTAEAELKQIYLFDYVVISRQDQVDRAAAETEAIITAEKCRVHPRHIVVDD